jgi:adenine C2-methylase RlmN of 23S rRNA A2503 and tRNA A37
VSIGTTILAVVAMVARRCLRPASVFDEAQLRRAFEDAGVKEVHIPAVWQHVIGSGGDNRPEDTPGLSGAAKQVLSQQFASVTSTVQEVQTSADGSTTKLLIRLQVSPCGAQLIGHSVASVML